MKCPKCNEEMGMFTGGNIGDNYYCKNPKCEYRGIWRTGDAFEDEE